MLSIIKRFNILILLLIIIFPLFLSLSNSFEFTFSRSPLLNSKSNLITFPLSFFYIIIFSFIFSLNLSFLKIEIILILFCILFIFIALMFNNLVVIKNFIGLFIFILSNIYFAEYFKNIKKNNLLKIFNKIFTNFIYVYSFLLIINLYLIGFNFRTFFWESISSGGTAFFLIKDIVIFNFSNYFSITLYVIATFYATYFKFNKLILFILFFTTFVYIYLSTSTITNLILIITLFYFFIKNTKIINILYQNYLYFIIFMLILIFISSKLINLNTIDDHNIFFRLAIIEYYLDTISLYNFIFPFSSYHLYNFSDHNQYFGFLAFGGIIFFYFILTYIHYIKNTFLNSQNYFTFTLMMIIIFGCFIQNFFTNIYFAVIFSFLINYSKTFNFK